MKKAKQWVAAALAASMALSQTVYAQEYVSAEPVETVQTVESSAAGDDETTETSVGEGIVESETADDEDQTVEETQEAQETETDAIAEETEAESETDAEEVLTESETETAPEQYAAESTDNCCGDNAVWSLDSDGTLTISGTGAMKKYSSTSETPWYGKSIKKLVVKEGITSLSDYAFRYQSELQSIELPSTLKEIGYYCFGSCKALQRVVLPDGLETIGEGAFEDNYALGRVVIPESVTSIGYSVFYGHTDSLYIVGTVGSKAESYAKSKNITFVDISEGGIPISLCVSTLDKTIFEYDGTAKKPAVSVSDSGVELQEGKDYSVSYESNTAEGTASAVIKGIGTDYSGEVRLNFDIASPTTKLTEGVNYIPNDRSKWCDFYPKTDGYYTVYAENASFDGDDGFDCTMYSNGSNENLYVKQKLSAGNDYRMLIRARSGNNNDLIKVTVKKVAVEGTYGGIKWTFNDNGELTLNGSNFTEDAKENYPWHALYGVTKKIVLGEGIDTIPYQAFSAFNEVTEVQLPNSLTTIGDLAFDLCSSLAKLTLPEGLKSIGRFAFRGCGFTSIEIPASVETIGFHGVGFTGSGKVVDGFKIYGTKGSAAETYASSSNISFVDVSQQKIALSDCEISVPATVIYEGKAVKPDVTVTYDSKTLVQGTDYTLTYANNTSEGTGTVTVTGIGKYEGTVQKSFNIKVLKQYSDTFYTLDYFIQVTSDGNKDWCLDNLNSDVSVENSNSQVCEVTYEKTEKTQGGASQKMTFRVHGLKAGEADFIVKDANQTPLFKYHITIKALPAEAVVFDDAVFQAEMIDKYDSQGKKYLTQADLDSIDKLDVYGEYNGEKIHSLEDLKKFSKVTSLNLRYFRYTIDYTPVTSCENLTFLQLNIANAEDLSWLPKCSKLVNLVLSYFTADSWDGLEQMTNLRYLTIDQSNLNIQNADMFAKMQYMRQMDLRDIPTLTDIQALKNLRDLQSLSLKNTGVTDEQKWKFAGIQDIVLSPGEKAYIPQYEYLFSPEITVKSGSDCVAVTTEGTSKTVIGLKQGTAVLHVTLSDTLSKDIKVIVNGASYEPAGKDYNSKFDTITADKASQTYILDENGALWTTYPEIKKLASDVKQFIADYAYVQRGQSKQYYTYYVDKNQALYQKDGTKLADNIVEAGNGGALDSKDNFYDLHTDTAEVTANVQKWISDSCYTYILKKDGSLWWKSSCLQQETFVKVSEQVTDIQKWGETSIGYLMSDGTVVTENYTQSEDGLFEKDQKTDRDYMQQYSTKAVSLGTEADSCYDAKGNYYILGENSQQIGSLKVSARVNLYDASKNLSGYLLLTEAGDVYDYNLQSSKLSKVDSGATLLNTEEALTDSWHYQKSDGSYYHYNGKTSDKVTSALLKKVNLYIDSYNQEPYCLYSSYMGYNKALVRYGSVFLDDVTNLWHGDHGEIYAIRTDGTLWNVTEFPVQIQDLSQHTHTIVKDAAVAATTEKPGKTEGSHCSACGEVITAQKDTVVTTPLFAAKADNNGGIAVSWKKVSYAEGYIVYRKSASEGWKRVAEIKGADTVGWTDTKGTAGIAYTYTVRAYITVDGQTVMGGFDSKGVTATPTVKGLSTVVLDKVADSQKGGIVVSWKAVEGAEGYRIFKKFTGSSWQKVTDVTANQLSYTDSSGVTGKTYSYTVRAFKHENGKEVFGGFDSKGLTATKLPAKVTLKEAKADNSGAITVSWNKLSTATGYRVFRKEVGGSWKGLGNVTANTITSYTDKNVTAGKRYTYTVRAYKVYDGQNVYGSFDVDGKSAVAQPAVSTPSTVKLISASAASGRKMTVKWEKADNCEGYVVYRKEQGKSWTRIAKAAGSSLTSYTDSTGTAGTTYTYTVRAYKTVNGKEVMGGFDSNGVSAQCKN